MNVRSEIMEQFIRQPSQLRVVRLMLSSGFSVRDGRIWSGDVEISNSALARAAGADRRIVHSVIEAIEQNECLRDIFSKLLPTTMLKNAAPCMGWGCIEIVPSNANEPGILASVASVISDAGISIRQAMVDDPDLTEWPKLYVITDSPIPSDLIPVMMECPGVKNITIF